MITVRQGSHGTISVRQGAALGDYSSAKSCVGQFQYGKELHKVITVRQGAAWNNFSTARSCMGQFQYGKELVKLHGTISVRQGAV